MGLLLESLCPTHKKKWLKKSKRFFVFIGFNIISIFISPIFVDLMQLTYFFVCCGSPHKQNT